MYTIQPAATLLYDTDFYRWALRQADLLRNEDYAELDLDNLIEELDAMARREKRQLANRLRVLLTHLLKLGYESTREPTRGWRATIREQRHRIGKLLADSPSLWVELPVTIQAAYTEARGNAADALNVDVAVFPVPCPWTPEQILDLNWLP